MDRATLWRWRQEGRIQPAWTTPGGHARWDMQQLRQQLGREEPVVSSRSATDPEEQPVVAAVVTSQLGVLVSRRHDRKPPWGFISGEIEPHESPTDAAVREIKEETGLIVRAGKREIGRSVHPLTGRTIAYLACTPVEGTDVFVGDEAELAEVKWVGLREAVALLVGLYPPVREHLERVLPPDS